MKKKTKISKKREYQNELKSLLKILSILIGILLISYLIIHIFVTDGFNLFNKQEESVQETAIQYNEILASETFNVKNDSYYIIFCESDNPYYSVYTKYINSSKDKKLYIVDLDNALNEKYVSEETNVKVQTINELKVKNHTMIKIENGVNVLYVEGKDNIMNLLKN